MNAHRSDTAYFLRDVVAGASVLLVALVAACSSSDTSSNGGGACTAGSTVTCACADGSTGSQTCGASTCTCAGHDSGSGADAAGNEVDSGGGEDAGEDSGNPTDGDGGHLHDAAPPASDAASGYNATCKVDKDCTDAVYDVCFVGGQRSICTKKCTTNADCPNPPTSGTCNKQNFCK